MKTDKEKWISDAMNSLDGIRTAAPTAALSQRIMEQLRPDLVDKKTETISIAGVYRIAAGVLVIATLNFYSCTAFQKSEQTVKDEPLKTFAKEYFTTDNSGY